MQRLLLLFVVCVTSINCVPDEDRVLHLPGLDPQPTFNHYAGYLKASGTKHFFYWFVESERNPLTDPVVLWLNGGPGCSSLTGLLVELGPWRTLPYGSGLEWFKHRWNKIANIIFLESPACVGYSFAEDGNCVTNDNQTASDNHLVLIDFFNKFPEYRQNDFYVTGESYAGIYVPTLAAILVDDAQFNFKGFAVGNSLTDRVTMNNGYPYYAWARGLFGSDLWDGLLDNCCVERNSSNCVFYDSGNPDCSMMYNQLMEVQWGIGLNPYNVYAECYGGAPDSRGVTKETKNNAEVIVPEMALKMEPHKEQQFYNFVRELSTRKNVTVRIPCSDTSDRETYLNRADVRAALHVNDSVTSWLPCSNLAYYIQYTDVRAEYYKVLSRGHRILAYYGDFDMACDHLSGMWFIESLGLMVEDPFKEWFYKDSMGYKQIAGFVSQYRNLKFVSVKGAGHFVPTDKPVQAYLMFEKFLNNEPY